MIINYNDSIYLIDITLEELAYSYEQVIKLPDGQFIKAVWDDNKISKFISTNVHEAVEVKIPVPEDLLKELNKIFPSIKWTSKISDFNLNITEIRGKILSNLYLVIELEKGVISIPIQLFIYNYTYIDKENMYDEPDEIETGTVLYTFKTDGVINTEKLLNYLTKLFELNLLELNNFK